MNTDRSRLFPCAIVNGAGIFVTTGEDPPSVNVDAVSLDAPDGAFVPLLPGDAAELALEVLSRACKVSLLDARARDRDRVEAVLRRLRDLVPDVPERRTWYSWDDEGER